MSLIWKTTDETINISQHFLPKIYSNPSVPNFMESLSLTLPSRKVATALGLEPAESSPI
jgi:hypothetical protein